MPFPLNQPFITLLVETLFCNLFPISVCMLFCYALWALKVSWINKWTNKQIQPSLKLACDSIQTPKKCFYIQEIYTIAQLSKHRLVMLDDGFFAQWAYNALTLIKVWKCTLVGTTSIKCSILFDQNISALQHKISYAHISCTRKANIAAVTNVTAFSGPCGTQMHI